MYLSSEATKVKTFTPTTHLCTATFAKNLVVYIAQSSRVILALMSVPAKVEEYVSTLDQALQCPSELDATAKWNAIRNVIDNAAKSTFGNRKMPSQNWLTKSCKG